MELWIRSQNKGALIKVEMLGNTDGTINSFRGNIKTELGTYKSSERALEVLDEIQKLLEPRSEYIQEIDTLTINFKNIDTIIYEMPEE